MHAERAGSHRRVSSLLPDYLEIAAPSSPFPVWNTDRVCAEDEQNRDGPGGSSDPGWPDAFSRSWRCNAFAAAPRFLAGSCLDCQLSVVRCQSVKRLPLFYGLPIPVHWQLTTDEV